MKISIGGLFMTLSISDSQHKRQGSDIMECLYAECRVLFTIMLSVVMLSDVMLSVVKLSVAFYLPRC
jgi:hypothetical protein